MRALKLTDAEIRKAKPPKKDPSKKHFQGDKYFDGWGLYMLVTPAGGKLWRLAYRFGGKQKTLALGEYPIITLARARELAIEARRQLAAGIDPGEVKKQRKAEAKAAAAGDTFNDIAGEFLKTPKRAGAQKKTKDDYNRSRTLLSESPTIKGKNIKTLKHGDFAAAVGAIEKNNGHDTAQKAARFANNTMDWAMRQGLISGNVAAGLTKDLPTKDNYNPRAAVHEPDKIKAILAKVDAVSGTASTRYALKIAPYVVLRTSELAGGEWREIDLDAATWTVPGERMKMKVTHIVPLAAPVIEMLRELYQLTGKGRYLFPSRSVKNAPVTSIGLQKSFRKAGIDTEEHTLHGWRTTFSTWANENGYNEDAIERQLAHKEKNKTRAAYDRGERMTERRELISAWAAYLENLKAGEVKS